MIYITGDCHGDFHRFNTKNFPEQKEMTADDYVIVVGDLGLIWNNSNEQEWWIKQLSRKSFTLLFIDGNHENHDQLAEMPVEEWHGGKTHVIAPNIRHLMRGQIFNINGKKIFTFGGASSHDIEDGILDPDDPDFKSKQKSMRSRNARFRIKGVSWWAREMPTDAEYEEGLQNLESAGWKVNCIITHCAPTSIQLIMDGGKREPDSLTEYLENIHQNCTYNEWFFGHYHKTRVVTEKDICVYRQILKFE